MYGVPSNLDLSFLINSELIQVCLGQHQLQFHFSPTGSISVEQGWALWDYSAGVKVDGRHDGLERPPYQLHRLLGRRVESFEVSAPSWFALRFESGEVLQVFDDSPNHESFQIEPGSIVV